MSESYILLVDDNQDDIDLTLRAIRKSNIDQRVVIARDGQEALDYLFAEGEYAGEEHELPSVVLLDLNMPRVGGLDVLKRLRAELRTEILPVVVLTTSDEQTDIVRSYKFGANSFITKPIDINQFLEAIQELHLYWTERNTSPPAPNT
ncbi:MAG: response regulator [Gammaproteobacteria bacterium]|nr:response regulator [Gammaproteobacteria bacterium]